MANFDGVGMANFNRVGVAAVARSEFVHIPVVGPFLALGAVTFMEQAPNLGRDLTHTALEALYKCRSCGHEAHVTYEITGPGNVHNEFGRYTKTYERPLVLVTDKNTSFLDIERVYRDMWVDYNFLTKNCRNWTKEITDRIWNLPSHNII
uniref:PPPDE domain-containing protein n=1 Tax=Globodera rostochiensis TaxID=31243 RepID=A0A914GPU4_GLORO